MLTLAAPEPVVSKPGPGLVTPPIQNRRETAFKYCKEFLQGAWRNVHFSDIVIHKISGGLSNLLYSCQLPDSVPLCEEEPRKVLVRFYGQVTRKRALETLITECVILTLLSERQRGPRLFGVFPGGRIEEYVPARPLLTQELANPNISSRIAEKVATIHLMDVPMNKTPTRMWDSMEKWLDKVEELVEGETPEDPVLTAMVSKLSSLKLRTELSWLRNFLEQIASPVVFCHNDLQEGNILLRNECEESTEGEECNLTEITADDLVVIDFEYCCYNYRGFDLANHFAEWKYDYKNDAHPYFWERPASQDPTQEQKERFVSTYLTVLQAAPCYRPRPQDTVEHILKEMDCFTLMSHMLWTLWSVVSNSNIDANVVIDFDYWCYGERRLEAYYNQKQHLLKTYNSSLQS